MPSPQTAREYLSASLVMLERERKALMLRGKEQLARVEERKRKMTLEQLLVHAVASQLTNASVHVQFAPGALTDKTAAENTIAQIQADWVGWLNAIFQPGSAWPQEQVDFAGFWQGVGGLLGGVLPKIPGLPNIPGITGPAPQPVIPPGNPGTAGT